MTQAVLHPILGLELAYWQETTIRVLLGLVALLLLTGGAVYLYLFKFVSFMQSRLGPMEAGPYGSMQLLAEVGKWLQKEDIFTEDSDNFIFWNCSCSGVGLNVLDVRGHSRRPERSSG